jgi:S-adenosylmethionine decarboxylase
MCDDFVEQELPGGGLLMYQSFTAVAPGTMSPRSTMEMDGWSSDGTETAEKNDEMGIGWDIQKKAVKTDADV